MIIRCLRLSFIVICLILISPLSTNAQSNKEIADSLKEVSKVQISQLKNGILLVRLVSKHDQIEYYNQFENYNAASELKTKTEKLNQYLIDGIRASFDFCPVYFFEDTYTQDVKAGNFEKVIFFTDSLQKDPTIKLPAGKLCYVGEYSYTKTDAEKSDKYYESSNLGVPALVIMDAKLNQLKRPFPYYCKFSSGLLNPKKIKTKIDKWNTNLEKYYSVNNISLE